MLFFGHAGPGAFLAKKLKLPLLATAFFALLPDLLDKPLYIAGLTPHARFLGHTLVFLLAAAALVWLLAGRALAASAAIGIGSHLALDAGHFLPLFYPLVQ